MFLKNVDKTFMYMSKLTGVTTSLVGVAKGSLDVAEVITYQDGICGVVSAIGVGADTLQIFSSFVPGPKQLQFLLAVKSLFSVVKSQNCHGAAVKK